MFLLKNENIKAYIKSYKDLIIFGLTVVVIHLTWKLGREASADDMEIYFYGINFSSFFNAINDFWAKLIHQFISIFQGTNVTINGNYIRYSDNDNGVRIIWGCSGIKELLMVFVVIATARGYWKQKLWYIPLGCIAIFLLNYLRLIMLTMVIHYSMNWFDFLHHYIGRIIMYGGLFLVWYIWVEIINKPKKENNIQEKNKREL